MSGDQARLTAVCAAEAQEELDYCDATLCNTSTASFLNSAYQIGVFYCCGVTCTKKSRTGRFNQTDPSSRNVVGVGFSCIFFIIPHYFSTSYIEHKIIVGLQSQLAKLSGVRSAQIKTRIPCYKLSLYIVGSFVLHVRKNHLIFISF